MATCTRSTPTSTVDPHGAAARIDPQSFPSEPAGIPDGVAYHDIAHVLAEHMGAQNPTKAPANMHSMPSVNNGKRALVTANSLTLAAI